MALQVEGIFNNNLGEKQKDITIFFVISGPNQFLQEGIMTLGFSYSCKSLSKYSPQTARKLANDIHPLDR